MQIQGMEITNSSLIEISSLYWQRVELKRDRERERFAAVIVVIYIAK